MSLINKIIGFLLLPKPFFSLFTSPIMAVLTAYIVGLRDIYRTIDIALFFLVSTAALNSFNNIMDARSDALTKKGYPLPKGIVTIREAAAFSLLAFTISSFFVVEFLQINIMVSLTMLADLILGFLFTAPKVRLKRLPILKAMVLVSHTLIFPLIIATALIGEVLSRFFNVLPPLILLGLAVHTLQDIGDVEGDKLMGDRTIPVLLGLKKTIFLTILMFSAALLYVLFLNVELKIVAVASIIFKIVLTLLLLWFSGRWYQVFMFESLLSLFVLWALLSG